MSLTTVSCRSAAAFRMAPVRGALRPERAIVNAALQSRIDELSKANDDMKNLLAATQIATIFLDMELCIHRFTPKATEIVPLAVGDTGSTNRPHGSAGPVHRRVPRI